MNTERPLDGFRSIKVKLGVLVGLSIITASVVSEVGDRADVPAWLTLPVTVAAAVGVTGWLARGMTSPLREMTAAAAVMATGDYSRRVTATSLDEVGELARAFNTMAADLANVDQQRRQLIATVSHELRTPLTAQLALLENLVDGVVTPDAEALRPALAQAERLGALVSDLLDLSRVEGGLRQLEIVEIDLTEMLEQGADEARAAGAGNRLITVETDVESDLAIEADAGRLAQVVANLLDNAVRHSPDGGTVTVRCFSVNSDRWALEVSDEGPGIPVERAERVFDRFGTWDESGGGTGLGLAIASWVCELHGGSIAVVPTDPDRPGARVRAVLPRIPRTTVHPDAPTAPKPPATKESPMSAAPSQVQSPIPPPPFAKPVPPPPFVDSLFGSLWPERDRTVRPGFVLASVGIGAAGALILPDRDAGLGTLLVLLSSGALVFYASVRRRAPWTIVLAVVAVGLSSMLVLRAAGWLSFIAVAIAGLLVMSALTDARGIMSIAGGWLSWGFAAIRGLPLLGRTLAAMSRFSILWPVARTAVISLLALVLFGGLFASGDAVFGSWAEAVLPNIKADGLVLRTFVGFVVTGFVLTACYVAINPPQINRLALPGGKRVSRPFEWLVPVGFVIAIFVAFVAAQATAMWGGHDYVQRTTGLTYAEYVHQGFGQLTLITFLTLVTVAIAARKAPRETAGELLTQRVVLGLLCALALVVVASALFRMNVYQEAYGFTVLRLLVIAFELWLGLLLVLVLIARLQSAAAWVPRAALISGAAFVLAIGLANPEAWVAQRNIDRYNDTGKIDPVYLGTLGDDAVPTIVAGLPRDLAMCILLDKAGSNEPHDALEWNLGRARSADAVSGLELPTWDDCAAIRATAH